MNRGTKSVDCYLNYGSFPSEEVDGNGETARPLVVCIDRS